MQFTVRDWIHLGTVVVVHLLVAVIYKTVVGLDIEPKPGYTWEWCWHTLPAAAVRTNMLHSVWHLHAQPPLYNVYGAMFIKMFYPHHLQYIHWCNIILGTALSGMVYVIARSTIGYRGISFVMALVLALTPSLFLFEAFVLYTLLAAFLVVVSVFWLSLFTLRKRRVFLYAFVLSVNLLILTRSVYHVAILLPVIVVACTLAEKRWKEALAVSLVFSLASVGWYGKNHFMFGFFGASSWAGQSLWKVARRHYTDAELRSFAENGVVDPVVVELRAFERPARYVKYGFDATSDVEVLGRNDYHNVNIIPISRLYGRNAFRLIRHDPVHYLRNVFRAFIRYCSPSSRFPELSYNASKISLHEAISSEVLHGQSLARLGRYRLGSFFFFLLPAGLMVYFSIAIRTCGFSLCKWRDYVRKDPVLLCSAFLIAYTTVVCCACEYGENARFRFLVEQVLWVFIIAVALRIARAPGAGRA